MAQFPAQPEQQKRLDARAETLTLGKSNFTLKKVSLSSVEESKFYTFVYGAETPGTKGKKILLPPNLYDRQPLLMILRADRKHILGLNTHYMSGLFDRGRFVFSFRRGLPTGKALFNLMVHQYKLSNVQSPLYEVVDMYADPLVLKTKADWQMI